MSTNLVPFRPSEVKTKEIDQLAQLRTGAQLFASLALAIYITDEESLKAAEQLGRDGSEGEKKVLAYFKPFVDSAHQLHKTWTTRRKEILDTITPALEHLQQEKAAYQDRLNVERQAQIASESERVQSVILEQAAVLEQAGYQDAAMAMISDIPQTLVAPVKLSGTSTRYKGEVANMPQLLHAIADGKVDPAFRVEAVERIADALKPLINKWATSQKQLLTIPGVRVKTETAVSFARK